MGLHPPLHVRVRGARRQTHPKSPRGHTSASQAEFCIILNRNIAIESVTRRRRTFFHSPANTPTGLRNHPTGSQRALFRRE